MKNEVLTRVNSTITIDPPEQESLSQRDAQRRSFLKGLGVAGAALSAGTLLSNTATAETKMSSGTLTKGDAAILRFLAAAEILETDLWLQYWELGGAQNNEFAKPTGGNSLYTEALKILTSFWTRYRIDDKNPDLDPNFKFPQADEIHNRTAIPRTDADTEGPASIEPLNIPDHLKAIAFTAGFHFASIEQGGTSLYPSLAQRVTSPEVLRILLSIGPTETAHFQTWQDKAGNALALTDTDPITGSTVTFKDLTTGQPESLQSNLIMPEPCPFLNRKFPRCSIIRPTNTEGAAMGAAKFLTASGLFNGQSHQFFEALTTLAREADAARREC